jgi:hypothetical protein
MAFMAVLFFVLWQIRSHYATAHEQLEVPATGVDPGRAFVAASPRSQTVVVPVDEINRAVLRTLAYARSISSNVIALHVTDSREMADALKAEWDQVVLDVPLVIIESPYRSLVQPIMEYVDAVDRAQPNQPITVVLPEFVTRRWWQQMLHNQLSHRLKRELMDRPNTVVVDVPYHLER